MAAQLDDGIDGADADMAGDELTEEQMQEEMNELSLPLREVHIPEGVFDVRGALAAGFTYKAFHKLVKNVKSLHDQGILVSAMAAGLRAEIWELHTMTTRDQFAKFARWTTSKAGADVISRLQVKRKLQQKLRPEETPAQLALVEILDQQRLRYPNEKNRVQRSMLEREIEDLKRRLQVKRRELEKLVAVDAKFLLPESIFKEPFEEEIGALSLQMFDAECKRTGKRHVLTMSGKLEYALKHYGSAARNNFMFNLATKRENRGPVIKFLAEEIISFRIQEDESGERKYYHALVAVCGLKAADAAVEAAVAARKDADC